MPASFTFFKKATSLSENQRAFALAVLSASTFFCWSWTTTAFFNSTTSFGLTTVPSHQTTQGCSIGCNIHGIAICSFYFIKSPISQQMRCLLVQVCLQVAEYLLLMVL
jgi:hypothetical protein